MTRLMAAIPTAEVLPMTQAPTAAVLLMEAVLMEVIPMEVILTADRILPPLRDRQFKQT